jgi:hypothetical protein
MAIVAPGGRPSGGGAGTWRSGMTATVDTRPSGVTSRMSLAPESATSVFRPSRIIEYGLLHDPAKPGRPSGLWAPS